MGYEATWVPSAFPDTTLAASNKVHYGDPTRDEGQRELEKVDFTPKDPWVEYFVPDFTGLFEAVRLGSTERITVFPEWAPAGITYEVLDVAKLYDGRTFRATLVRA